MKALPIIAAAIAGIIFGFNCTHRVTITKTVEVPVERVVVKEAVNTTERDSLLAQVSQLQAELQKARQPVASLPACSTPQSAAVPSVVPQESYQPRRRLGWRLGR